MQGLFPKILQGWTMWCYCDTKIYYIDGSEGTLKLDDVNSFVVLKYLIFTKPAKAFLY